MSVVEWKRSAGTPASQARASAMARARSLIAPDSQEATRREVFSAIRLIPLVRVVQRRRPSSVQATTMSAGVRGKYSSG